MTEKAPEAPAGTRPRQSQISELFYSFQGEGVNLGRRALFVRFMECNLTCGYPSRPESADARPTGAMICDTEYTWNGAKHHLTAGVRRLDSDELWAELMRLDPSTRDSGIAPVDLIVASGGEPLMHRGALIDLADRAAASDRRVEIETNATIRPGADLVATGVSFNAGLKLASCAVPRAKRIKPEAIAEIQASGRARWKFVVCDERDLDEVEQLQAEFGLTEIWLSPEGTTPELVMERMSIVAESALAHGWNLTTREHVLIWGDKRGK